MPTSRTTNTYATMEVSDAVFAEIEDKLGKADYLHCINDEGLILENIMLVKAPRSPTPLVEVKTPRESLETLGVPAEQLAADYLQNKLLEPEQADSRFEPPAIPSKP